MGTLRAEVARGCGRDVSTVPHRCATVAQRPIDPRGIDTISPARTGLDVLGQANARIKNICNQKPRLLHRVQHPLLPSFSFFQKVLLSELKDCSLLTIPG
jgi:hypothetical protein